MENNCPICGRPLPENVAACPKCGMPIPQKPLGTDFLPSAPVDSAPLDSAPCAICGKSLPEGAESCPNCGSPVHIELVAPQSEPEPP